jgi:hypothetical protein
MNFFLKNKGKMSIVEELMEEVTTMHMVVEGLLVMLDG